MLCKKRALYIFCRSFSSEVSTPIISYTGNKVLWDATLTHASIGTALLSAAVSMKGMMGGREGRGERQTQMSGLKMRETG